MLQLLTGQVPNWKKRKPDIRTITPENQVWFILRFFSLSMHHRNIRTGKFFGTRCRKWKRNRMPSLLGKLKWHFRLSFQEKTRLHFCGSILQKISLPLECVRIWQFTKSMWMGKQFCTKIPTPISF